MLLYVFSSDRCVPCKFLKENLKRNNIPFVEMNFDKMNDKERVWSNKFKIKSLPTLIFMDDSKKVKNIMSGTVPINQIKDVMKKEI